MLNAPDRLDGRPDRGGALGVDQDCPDQLFLGAGEPAADGLVAAFRQFKLAVGQFESLAQTFQNADKLHISHDRSLIGVHFHFSGFERQIPHGRRCGQPDAPKASLRYRRKLTIATANITERLPEVKELLYCYSE